jgi:hypothetical protein
MMSHHAAMTRNKTKSSDSIEQSKDKSVPTQFKATQLVVALAVWAT